MARFRLRDLMNRYPVLDRFRINVCTGAITTALRAMDHNYDILRVHPDSVRPYLEGEKPCIFAVYHGRMCQILKMMDPRAKAHVMVSMSRDGEIIARSIEALGLTVIRGSAKKGLMQATKDILKETRRGESLMITVDGPRGPIYEAKIGIIRIAEMTGLPIIPAVASVQRYSELWGWDSFVDAHLGSREVFMYRDPIVVPKGSSDEDREQLRLHLTDVMAHMRDQVDDFWPSVGLKQEIHR